MSDTLSFGNFLKQLRTARGLGLREAARLIDERASNYCAIESGRRMPYRDAHRIERIAKAFGIEVGSEDWDELFHRAGFIAPPDVAELLNCRWMPNVLRAIKDCRITERDLPALLAAIRSLNKQA